MADTLIQLGPWGLFIAAFLAGSVFPFTSEVVLLAMLGLGEWDPVELLIYATIGNVLGSCFNYCVGRLGKVEWIEKLHISKEKLEKAQQFVRGHGAWMGFFAFIPILGSAITVTLGLMRANVYITVTSITIGKFSRYFLITLPFI